ncbi:GLUG motif-containing protein [Desulfoscipio gibsoniae]|uniref:GLUG motif-containing protein n=1 Tax=Desulfoscipio gibsoniae TaxID=102134 RepID=UPI0012FE9CD3
MRFFQFSSIFMLGCHDYACVYKQSNFREGWVWKKKSRSNNISGIVGYSSGGMIKNCSFNGTIKIKLFS